MQKKLKPVSPELLVRDSKTMKPLPAEGALVEMDSYWLRRLMTGDVVEVLAPTLVAPELPKTENQTKK